MVLLDEILSWSTTLLIWQGDAVRRLFQQKDLTQQDYDDLYAMLKAAHGIPDPQNRQPIPLAAEHLPTRTTEATVVLKAMRDLQHVNRIASGQTLIFSPTGITVIYGENSSGKSGYGQMGAFSLNAFKTITCGDGGLLATSDNDLHEKAFGYHDQGHSPLRAGVEVGRRSIVGLDFRMCELSAAVALAQLRKIERILAALRERKRIRNL